MAEGGEGIIPPYKPGQEIKPGESFILQPGQEYRPQIDKNPNDHVVQDKVSTREQPLSVEEQTTAGQVAEARALLRDLPPNTPLKDKRAAEKLLEEALINDNPSEKADPNARGAWADAQNAKKPSNDSGQEWFGWVKKLLKRTG